MKLPSTSVQVFLVLFVLAAVFIGNTESNRKGKKGKPGVCKYQRKGDEGPCEANNTKSITLLLKKGDPATCQPTKVITNRPCNDNSLTKRKRIKVCKYERQGAEGPCEANNTKTITFPLKKGDPATCPPAKTITNRPCNDNSLTKRTRIKGCKYDRKSSDWTDCVAKEKTKVMKLKEGSNPKCPATKTKSKLCGSGKKKTSRNSRKDA